MGWGRLDEDHNIVPLNTVEEYIEWLSSVEDSEDNLDGDVLRRVAKTDIGDYWVSTVFLGSRHFNGWFETMVFGPIPDEIQVRYETWDEAAAGHRAAVATVEGMK